MNIKTIFSILRPSYIKKIFSKTANSNNDTSEILDIPAISTDKDKPHSVNNFNSNPNLIDYSKSVNNIDSAEQLKASVKDMELWDDDFIDSLEEKIKLRDEELIEIYSFYGWELIHTDKGQKLVDLYAEKFYKVLEINLGHTIHTIDLKELSYAVVDPYYFVHDLENALNKNMIKNTQEQRFNSLIAARDIHVELIRAVKNKVLEDPMIQEYTLDGYDWMMSREGDIMVNSYNEKFYSILQSQLQDTIDDVELKFISRLVFDSSDFNFFLNDAIERSSLKPTNQQIEKVSNSLTELHKELIEYAKIKGKE